jgi:two-component sensor histidine kinase/CheY-like chemotaxis protein
MNTERKRILLVEDEAIIALARRKLLEKTGYEVEHAPNGEVAIEAARKKIDLVLMDIDLGAGIKGTEVASRILAERDVPIIFLTSNASPEMIDSVRNITHYGYVTKATGEFAFFSTIETAFALFDSQAKVRADLRRCRLLAEHAEEMIRSQEALALEKATRLREVHHRMKGGIEVIAGLLSLEEAELAEGCAAPALRNARRRLFALGILYDMLCRSSDYRTITVREYLEDLAIGLARSHAAGLEIAVETYVDNLSLDIGQLLPLGMIVQELISISLENAFPEGHAGMISLAAYKDADGAIEVVVSDDGIAATRENAEGGGIGLELVQGLAQQLSATVELRRRGGTTYRIRFFPEQAT